jgi:hypothetical protein
LGRFVSKDPFVGSDRDGQSLNRYVYALNSPMILIDPSGLFSWSTLGASVTELGNTIGHFTVGVSGLVASGVAFEGGGFLGYSRAVTSYVSALDELNEASKSITATFQNVVNAFTEAPPVTSEDFEGQGILDSVLNTKVGKVVTNLSGIFGLLDAAVNITDLYHSGQSILSAIRNRNFLGNFALQSVLTNSATSLDQLFGLYELGLNPIYSDQIREILVSGRFINVAQAPIVDIMLEVQPNRTSLKK